MNTNKNPLLDFVSQVSGDTYLKVEENLGDGFVRLKTSEAERRQAKHDIRQGEDIIVELLRNSRDAHAARIFVATTTDKNIRTLTVIDDGVGVPVSLQEKIFEPRVTSKLETMVIDEWGVHGRGMALYSISQNVVECSLVASAEHKGAAIRVVSDTAELKERADQSTWPKVTKDPDGTFEVVSGPKNLIRHITEFAIAHPELNVYIGSPAEIVSVLRSLARVEKAASDPLNSQRVESLPVWLRPGYAHDSAELTDIAEEIGLSISERTAHRIMRGEIAAPRTVFDIVSKATVVEEKGADIYKDVRGLKLHGSDLAEFGLELERAFDTLAERYYLSLHDAPKISVTKSAIRVTFNFDKDE